LWLAFATSWVIHTVYDESVDYFGLSPTVQLIQVALLIMLLTGLMLGQPASSRSATR
jgi:hypothetical protein